jgi:hypothetical protein
MTASGEVCHLGEVATFKGHFKQDEPRPRRDPEKIHLFKPRYELGEVPTTHVPVDATVADDPASTPVSAPNAKQRKVKRPRTASRGTNQLRLYMADQLQAEIARVKKDDLTHPSLRASLDELAALSGPEEKQERIKTLRTQRLKIKQYLQDLDRRYHVLLERVKQRVLDCHRKIASFLVANFRIILIPWFQVQQMTNRTNRNINSTAARKLLTWAHGSFREILEEQAQSKSWVDIIHCDEPHTSKTCGGCRQINDRLGSSKTFKCPNGLFCSYEVIKLVLSIIIRFSLGVFSSFLSLFD